MAGLYVILVVLVVLAIYCGKKYEDEKRDNKRLKDYLISKGVNPDKDIPYTGRPKSYFLEGNKSNDPIKELFDKTQY